MLVKANRVDRRAKIDPNAVQPIGKCQRRKSERYAKNVAEKLRNVDQASSQATMEKQSKAFEFFKQRLALVMDRDALGPVPAKWQHMNMQLRRAGLAFPADALEKGVGSAKGKGDKGGKSKGKGSAKGKGGKGYR